MADTLSVERKKEIMLEEAGDSLKRLGDPKYAIKNEKDVQSRIRSSQTLRSESMATAYLRVIG